MAESLDDKLGRLFTNVYKNLPRDAQQEYMKAHPQGEMPSQDDDVAMRRYNKGVISDLEGLAREYNIDTGAPKRLYSKMAAVAAVAGLALTGVYFL